MHVALNDLKLDRIDVVHAGKHSFPIASKMRAVALARIASELRTTAK
jgi:hypothetical protein